MTRMVRTILATAVAALAGAVLAVGDAAPDPLPLYLRLAHADLAELYERDLWAVQRLPVEFRLSPDEPWQTAEGPGIRFRGTSSRVLPKKSFSVVFAEPQPFAFDTPRLELVAMYTDPSFLRAVLAFGMFRDLGLPASRTRYLDLYLDDAYEGLYVAIQRVDRDLLVQHGLPTESFTLVRDEFRHSGEDLAADSMFSHDWALEPDPVALLRRHVDSRGTPDWEALSELVAWVDATPAGPEFARGFRERFDLGAFLDWLAVHVLISDVDSFADDYWLYRDDTDPAARWSLLPWDMDLSFGSHWVAGPETTNDFFHYQFTPRIGWHNALVVKFLDTEELHDSFVARTLELMDEVFPVGYLAQRIAEISPLISASVERTAGPGAFERHQANHFGEPGFFEQHAGSLVDFVELRYQFLRRHFDPLPPEASPYTASLDVSALRAGDVAYLTDSFGWTIARLEVTAAPAGAATLVARVEADARFADVDRLWTFDLTGAPLAGLLTLYYRNGVVDANWYRPELPVTPVGDQRRLSLARVELEEHGEVASVEPLGSDVNPYSNAVATTEPIVLHGRASFALVDRGAP